MIIIVIIPSADYSNNHIRHTCGRSNARSVINKVDKSILNHISYIIVNVSVNEHVNVNVHAFEHANVNLQMHVKVKVKAAYTQT